MQACEKANGCSHGVGALPSHLCCQQLLELFFAHTLSVHHCLAREPWHLQCHCVLQQDLQLPPSQSYTVTMHMIGIIQRHLPCQPHPNSQHSIQYMRHAAAAADTVSVTLTLYTAVAESGAILNVSWRPMTGRNCTYHLLSGCQCQPLQTRRHTPRPACQSSQPRQCAAQQGAGQLCSAAELSLWLGAAQQSSLPGLQSDI